MLRILWVLIISVLLQAESIQAIEIYADGKRFATLSDFQKSDHRSVKPLLRGDFLRFPQEQDVLSQISYDQGVSFEVESFDNPQPGSLSYLIEADEVESVIRRNIERHQGPAMLIVEPNKMRILSYTHSQEDIKSQQFQNQEGL